MQKTFQPQNPIHNNPQAAQEIFQTLQKNPKIHSLQIFTPQETSGNYHAISFILNNQIFWMPIFADLQ